MALTYKDVTRLFQVLPGRRFRLKRHDPSLTGGDEFQDLTKPEFKQRAARGFWNDYQHAFEDTLQHTSTKWAPWWVIPADHKWVTRALVAGITTESTRRLGLKRPAVTTEQQRLLARARRQLLAEKN